MDTKSYHKLVDTIFSKILEFIDTHVSSDVDVDKTSELLSITDDKGREILISKQEYRHEIWLSSPFSGAYHFSFNSEKNQWLSTRDRLLELLSFLEKEISTLARKQINLRF